MAAAALAGPLLTGCGNNYRPVVTSINPVGPAGQPTKYAVAVSANQVTPGSPLTYQGVVTIVDFSGDTILDTTLLGVDPTFFTLDTTGTEGYTLNGDGTLTSFGVATSLIQSEVTESTLLPGATPTMLYSQGNSLYMTEPGRTAVAQLTGLPPGIKVEIPTPTAPTWIVGATSSPRAYAIVPGTSTSSPGTVSAIETGTNTVSASLPVGNNPVFGVMSSDSRRAFILNKGSNTVTVINAQANAVDTFTSGSTRTGTIPVGTAPVWADLANPLSEMVVANAGNGVTPGSVTVISIPLCNATTVTTNPNCDSNNPVDAAGFGSVVANIPVGINPVMVAVLADGSQAYVANAGNPALPCALPAAGQVPNCSVTAINLTSNTVIATIPFIAGTAADSYGHGHPNWIAVSNAAPTGKVYVTAGDSTDMTVLRTDVNTVVTHIPLQGFGVAVRTTAP